jgi:anthranilate phosphoribosyltransferase
VVLLNASAALVVAGAAINMNEGVKKAADIIDGGKAKAKLEALVEATNG